MTISYNKEIYIGRDRDGRTFLFKKKPYWLDDDGTFFNDIPELKEDGSPNLEWADCVLLLEEFTSWIDEKGNISNLPTGHILHYKLCD